MPLAELNIAPGIVTEQTARGAKGRWTNCNRVRFRELLPEKLGGWQSSALEGDSLLGTPRAAIDWRAINGDGLTAIGTRLRLYQSFGGEVVNITPYALATDAFGGAESELTDPFDTTDTESIVEVTHASHGLQAATTVYFDNATAVGGLTIDGEYQVVEVLDSSTYTIDAGSAATSTANGGGTVDYAYEINIGVDIGSTGKGWGASGYGESTWGTPRDITGISFAARTWALSTWGEDLIANPRGLGIYTWDKSVGYASTNRAEVIANAPANANFALVSPIDRHLIAFGCTPAGGSALDPLVIRWCDQNDFTTWTAARTNTAGERRLDNASEIMSALPVREEICVFTDISLYTMTFIGPPATFNIRQLASECGLAGPLARAAYGGIAFWMSYENFFYYDGAVDILPCPIRNHVFDDMNTSQRSKFFCGVNSLFQEVMFFYCSAAATEIDRYALFQVKDRVWTFGELSRTAWLDTSSVRTVPAGFDADGVFYDHESGSTDDGVAMGEFIESCDVEIDQSGDHLLFLRRLVPDFLTMTGPMSITLKARKYPHGEQITRGPYTVTPTNGYIRPRIRGRQVQLRVESDQDMSDTDWRMGTWRVDARQHGRR